MYNLFMKMKNYFMLELLEKANRRQGFGAMRGSFFEPI